MPSDDAASPGKPFASGVRRPNDAASPGKPFASGVRRPNDAASPGKPFASGVRRPNDAASPGKPFASGASQRLPLGGSSAQLYQYSVIQLVPDVSRGERINAGVVLLARTAGYLGLSYVVDEPLWLAVAPGLDVPAVVAQLAGIEAVAEGLPSGGPMAALTPAQRFHWITSPGSTVVQPSAVHTGLCGATAFPGVLDELVARLLARS